MGQRGMYSDHNRNNYFTNLNKMTRNRQKKKLLYNTHRRLTAD